MVQILLFEAGGQQFGALLDDVAYVTKMTVGRASTRRVELAGEVGGPPPSLERGRIVVARATDTGIVVDAVDDIIGVPLADVLPLPSFMIAATRLPYVRRVARTGSGDLIVLLDLDKI